MNPSDPGPRFRPQIRHYHRHRPGNPSSWEEWVGTSETDDAYRRLTRGMSVLVVVALLATLVTAWVRSSV